jgi:hypothetical protein
MEACELIRMVTTCEYEMWRVITKPITRWGATLQGLTKEGTEMEFPANGNVER